jgi:hypothetical protein
MLLPAMAAALYLEGQRYDSALINFQSVPGQSLEPYLPREIAGFQRTGQIQGYNKENLYEYVNGHAEYFIGAGFEQLAVADYVRSGSDSIQADAVVEIYDLGKQIQAFGVLADEAGEHPLESGVGLTGFRSAQGLNFVTGQYYIKVRAFNEVVPAMAFARSIENEMGEGSDALGLFEKFPDLGTVVNTRFIKEAYRGLGFVENVIEREFDISGNRIHVFLVTGDEGSTEELTDAFVAYFKESGIPYAPLQGEADGYEVQDPYEGTWYLVRSKEALFGIFGAADRDILKKFIKDSGTAGTTKGLRSDAIKTQ